MIENLVIVESPAKAKTIEKFLGKDFQVTSSMGHIRDLAKKENGIDLDNNYKPQYIVPDDKKKIVSNLKKQVKNAKTVWLASDEDREGEAIAWHLCEVLKLDSKTTRRIVFHEITQKAIKDSISNYRTIDKNLVDAQQARRILDRLVGFELSPVLWRKVKPSLSAGRVQSVAVRLIVEREREIINFKSLSSYKVQGVLKTDKKATLKAELDKKFESKEKAQEFLESCKKASFAVSSVIKKPSKKSPAAPFITSTLQQEASRKLGFSVSQTMSVAQRLYEAGNITYMRTDSVNLSAEAMKGANDIISKEYGADYAQSRQFKTKSKGAQEAHEAIRPTYLNKKTISAASNEQRLYELIWKRTVASQMADARLEKTTIDIEVSGRSERFKTRGEVLKFEGFLKVYFESTDEEPEEETQGLLPPLGEGEILDRENIVAIQRFTQHPPRYTEASLVRKLEEQGIGRPSTYAPTISTIQNRGYILKENREGTERKYIVLKLSGDNVKKESKTEITGAEKAKLFPDNIGMIVNDFLTEYFNEIMDYSFTASVEKQFDDIALGKMEWAKMIDKFYKPFHKTVETTLEVSDYTKGERELGNHPETKEKVFARMGKFGPIVQIGESEEKSGKKPQYASMLKGQQIETITLDDALTLFKLPKDLGTYEGEDVTVAIGRFGPYVKFGTMYVSLPKGEDPMEVELTRAIELIKAKQKADAPIGFYEDMPVQKGVGRFGPFIKWNNTYINVNKKYDFDNLSQDDINNLIEDKKRKDIEKIIHNWEEEGIRVEKARWGRSNIIKGKIKIEMAKTVDASKLTLEEVKSIIEQNAPKKKTTKKKSAKK